MRARVRATLRPTVRPTVAGLLLVAILVPALVAALGATLSVPVAEARTSTCTGGTGQVAVAIVVDHPDAGGAPGDSVDCVVLDAPRGWVSGLDVLNARAARLGRPGPRFDTTGLICGLDGFPVTACPTGSGSFDYWSYWWGGSSWTYASLGPAGHRLRTGDVVGWRFQLSASDRSAVPPSASAVFAALFPGAPATTAPATTAPATTAPITAPAATAPPSAPPTTAARSTAAPAVTAASNATPAGSGTGSAAGSSAAAGAGAAGGGGAQASGAAVAAPRTGSAPGSAAGSAPGSAPGSAAGSTAAGPSAVGPGEPAVSGAGVSGAAGVPGTTDGGGATGPSGRSADTGVLESADGVDAAPRDGVPAATASTPGDANGAGGTLWGLVAAALLAVGLLVPVVRRRLADRRTAA